MWAVKPRSLTDGWVRYFTTWPFRRLWAHRSQNVRCNCQQKELTWSYPATENDPNIPWWVYVYSTQITKCKLCIVIKGYATCGDPTTSPTRWPASIACASLRESSSRSPYWHIKSSTDLRRGTSALLHVSPTYPVDDRCVLSAPIAW